MLIIVIGGSIYLTQCILYINCSKFYVQMYYIIKYVDSFSITPSHVKHVAQIQNVIFRIKSIVCMNSISNFSKLVAQPRKLHRRELRFHLMIHKSHHIPWFLWFSMWFWGLHNSSNNLYCSFAKSYHLTRFD